MILRLTILVLIALPLWADVAVVTSLVCRVRDRAVIWEWTTDITSGDAARVYYDYDDVSLDRRTRQVNSGAAASGRRASIAADLNPFDTVYFRIESSDSTKTDWSNPTCTTTCTNCSSTDQALFADSSGCNCGGVGEHPNISTPVEDSDPTPTAPSHSVATTPPTVTGGTYTVASDCSDLTTQHNSAETDAEAGADVVELVLPAGVACAVASFELRNISSGTIIVRSSADPKLLPPAGTRIDKTYRPHVARLTISDMKDLNDDGSSGFIDTATTAQGYYFWGVEISGPDLDSSVLTPVTMTITNIDVATDTITVSDISSLNTGNSGDMVHVNLSGTGVLGGYGPFQACNVTSTVAPAGTFQLRYNARLKGFCNTQGTLVDLTGTYGSGGSVRRFVTQSISSIADCGDGTECLTVTAHGLSDYPNATVSSGSGATLTINETPGDYQMGNSAQATANAQIVHVEGTGVGTCNGLWSANWSGSVATLTRTGSTADCNTVSAGTVHGHRAISVIGTNDDDLGDEQPRSWNFEVTDANTLQLLESTHQAGASGGYVFWEVGRTIAAYLSNGSNITFDRTLWLACLPWMGSGGFNINTASSIALINSHVETCNWERTNPVENAQERIHGNFTAHNTITTTAATDIIIKNNFFGFVSFIFNDSTNQGPEDDFTLDQNHFWRPNWTVDRHADYRGHRFEASFVTEHKGGGSRMSISANHFKGWGSTFQITEPAIELSLVGAGSATHTGFNNIRMNWNIFERGGTILQSDTASLTADRRFDMPENIEFKHNLMVDTDSNTYSQSGNVTGGLIENTTTPFIDFVMERNTYCPRTVLNSNILDLGNHRGTGFRMVDNIFCATGATSNADLGIEVAADAGSSEPIPNFTTGGGNPGFEEFFVRGTTFDSGTSQITGNIWLPGIISPASGDFETKAASTNPADTHCQSSLAALNNYDSVPGTYIGNTNTPCDESYNTRKALVFQSGSWRPTVTYAAKGADIPTILDQHGHVETIAVTGDADELTISFHQPTTTGLFVDLAPWNTDWATTWNTAGNITRLQDAGGDQNGTVTFTGLSSLTLYAYRIHGSKIAIGEATTGQ